MIGRYLPVSLVAIGLTMFFYLSASIMQDNRSAAQPDQKQSELAKFGNLADFRLTDRHSNTVLKSDLQGSVWLLHTFFTKCEGICPTLIGDLRNIIKTLPEDQRPALLSVSIDPGHDNPETLAAYAGKYDIDSLTEWILLTGDQSKVASFVNDSLKLGFPAEANDHSPRVLVVDKQLEIRGFFRIPEDNAKLLEAIQTLVPEPASQN